MRRKRDPQQTVFPVTIKQGTVHVTANNAEHAKRQAYELERHIRQHYWVHGHVEYQPGVFILGSEAKVKQGVEVFSCS